MPLSADSFKQEAPTANANIKSRQFTSEGWPKLMV